MSTLPPSEIVISAEKSALQKIEFSTRKTVILGILAGIYIAMGGLLSLLIGSGFPEITNNNPGLQKLLSGCMFPLGLILVVIAGAELFTGNNAILIPGVLNDKYKWTAVWKNWVIVYFSNFIGALFFVYVMVHTVFLKGIGANWLVCLAVWLGMSSSSTAGKFIGLWFPVMGFVAIGYEHSIANMFFIPLGMLQGADISVYDFLVSNLIPATLGNIIGGALFVGSFYWYAYLKK